MSAKSSLWVTCTKDVVYCKIEGMGSMRNSSPLRTFSENLCDDGYLKFVVDLGGCTGMDSTFMGTILGIALFQKRDLSPQVVLVNVSPDHFKLLDGLGVTQLVKVEKRKIPFPQVQLTELSDDVATQKEKLQTIGEAHKNLMEIDPRNVKKFGRFLKALLNDLT